MSKYLVTLSPKDNISMSWKHDIYCHPKGGLSFVNRIVEFKNELPIEEELESLRVEDTKCKDSYGCKVYNYYSIVFMQKLM